MTSLQTLHAEMKACCRCLQTGHTIVPGAVFSGKHLAERRVMLIGQAPGVTEAEVKRPFNAGSGKRLFQWLGEAGWEEDAFRARQYMTAVTKCYPGKGQNGKGDRVPSKAEQALCRPFLEREIALLNPRLMILVGGVAIKLLFPARATLEDVVGTAVYFPPAALTNPVNFDLSMGSWLRQNPHAHLAPLSPNGRLVVPLPHPSGASLWPNKPANQALIGRAIQLLHDIRVAWHLT